LVLAKHRQRTGTVGHLDHRYPNRMRQPLRIDRNMLFDARHFLAGVIPFIPSGIRVFHVRLAGRAKYRHFSTNTESHKKHRRDPLVSDVSCADCISTSF
jgi:hypothetical protein